MDQDDKEIEEFRRELLSFPLINDDPSSPRTNINERVRVDALEHEMLSRITWDSPYYRMFPFQPFNPLCPAEADEQNKRRTRITQTCVEFRDEVRRRADKARDRLDTLWTQFLCPDFHVPVFQDGEKINGLELDEKLVYPTYEVFCLLNTDWHDMLVKEAHKLQPAAEASSSSSRDTDGNDNKFPSDMSASDRRACEAIDQTRAEIKRLVDSRKSKRHKSNCRKRYERKRRMYKRFESNLFDLVMPHWIRHEAELPHSARTRYHMGRSTALQYVNICKAMQPNSEQMVAFDKAAKWLFNLPYPREMMVRVVQWLDNRSAAWSSAKLVETNELTARFAAAKFAADPTVLGFDPRAVSQLCEWILRKSRVCTSSYEPRIKLLDEIAHFRRPLAMIICGYAYEMAWYKLIGTVKTQAEAREILNTPKMPFEPHAITLPHLQESSNTGGWAYKPRVVADHVDARAPPRLNLSSYPVAPRLNLSSYSREMLRSESVSNL